MDAPHAAWEGNGGQAAGPVHQDAAPGAGSAAAVAAAPPPPPTSPRAPLPPAANPAKVSDLLVDMNAANAAVSAALSGIFAVRKPSHSEGGGGNNPASPTRTMARATTMQSDRQQRQSHHDVYAQQQRSPLARSISATFKQRSGRSVWALPEDSAVYGCQPLSPGWNAGASPSAHDAHGGGGMGPPANARMLGPSKSFTYDRLPYTPAYALHAAAGYPGHSVPPQRHQHHAALGLHQQQQQQMAANNAAVLVMMNQLQLVQQQHVQAHVQQQQQRLMAAAVAQQQQQRHPQPGDAHLLLQAQAQGMVPGSPAATAASGVGGVLPGTHPAQLQHLNLLAAATNQQLLLNQWQQKQLMAAAASASPSLDALQCAAAGFQQLSSPTSAQRLMPAHQAGMLAEAALAHTSPSHTALSAPATPQPYTARSAGPWGDAASLSPLCTPPGVSTGLFGMGMTGAAAAELAQAHALGFAHDADTLAAGSGHHQPSPRAPPAPPPPPPPADDGNDMLVRYERLMHAALAAARATPGGTHEPSGAVSAPGLLQLQQEHSLLLPLLGVLLGILLGTASEPDAAADLSFLTVSARRHLAEWPALSEPFRCALNTLAHAVFLMFSGSGWGSRPVVQGSPAAAGAAKAAAAAGPLADPAGAAELQGSVLQLLETLAARDDELQQALVTLAPAPRPAGGGTGSGRCDAEGAAITFDLSRQILTALHQSVMGSAAALEQALRSASASGPLAALAVGMGDHGEQRPGGVATALGSPLGRPIGQEVGGAGGLFGGDANASDAADEQVMEEVAGQMSSRSLSMSGHPHEQSRLLTHFRSFRALASASPGASPAAAGGAAGGVGAPCSPGASGLCITPPPLTQQVSPVGTRHGGAGIGRADTYDTMALASLFGESPDFAANPASAPGHGLSGSPAVSTRSDSMASAMLAPYLTTSYTTTASTASISSSLVSPNCGDRCSSDFLGFSPRTSPSNPNALRGELSGSLLGRSLAPAGASTGSSITSSGSLPGQGLQHKQQHAPLLGESPHQQASRARANLDQGSSTHPNLPDDLDLLHWSPEALAAAVQLLCSSSSSGQAPSDLLPCRQ